MYHYQFLVRSFSRLDDHTYSSQFACFVYIISSTGTTLRKFDSDDSDSQHRDDSWEVLDVVSMPVSKSMEHMLKPYLWW